MQRRRTPKAQSCAQPQTKRRAQTKRQKRTTNVQNQQQKRNPRGRG